MRYESWRISYQSSEQAARAALEELATLRAQLAAAGARAERYRAALREVEPYLDAIICYASTQGEHHPNKIAADIRAALAEGEAG